MLYCEARPSWVGSAGLGNRLYPWARCRVYVHLHGVPMLVTRWAQLPVGSLLRRDAEPRIYANLFTRRHGDVTGWRRAYVWARAKNLAEPENLSDAVPDVKGLGLVVFAGLGRQFEPLNDWHELVRQELVAITCQVWRKKAETVPVPFVGIHVRRGDFARVEPATNLSQADNTITPLEWFVESLKAMRARLADPIPALVTSDGSPDELSGLLEMQNVRLVSTGSAIGDLLLLSRAVLLLASGSSFSAWASYLGQMPTLSHPGQSLTRLFNLRGQAGQFVGEFDPSQSLSEPLLGNLRGLFQAK